MTRDIETPVNPEALDPLDELGLGGTTLQPLGLLRAVRDGAHGLARAAELRAAEREALASVIAERPDFVELLADRLPAGAVRLVQWVHDPSIRGIASAQGAVRITGAWLELEGLLLASGTEGSPRARLTSELGDFVLDFSVSPPGVFGVLATEEPALELPAHGAPVDAPPMASLTGGLDTAPWLAEAYRARAQSPRAFLRAAAVGLVGRLWSAEGAAARALYERALTGERLPSDHAREWARTSGAAVRSLLPIALAEAEELLDLIDAAPESLGEALGVELRSIVVRRDDLESFAFVARAAGASTSLDETLRELDAVASSHATLFDVELDLAEDEHFREVFTSEPVAWWGLPAGPH